MCPRGRGGSGPIGPGRVAKRSSHGVEGRCPSIVRKKIDAPALGASRAGPPFPYLRWSGSRREWRRGGHGRGRPAALPRLWEMPDLARSFNDVAAAYDLGRPRYDDHAIDAIAAAAGGGPRLLDVGAGTGRLSGPLLEKGYDVVAVEPLDAMRAILTRAIGPDRAL